MTCAPVVVSAATERRALPYVEALKAAGVPGEALRVVTPAGDGTAPAAPAPAIATTATTATTASGGAASAATGASAAMAAMAATAAMAAMAAMDGAAGLVLCGGCDVAPSLYGETPLAAAGLEVLAERDALEWQLLAAARERRLPVWGVCRGLQLINVFLGGSLWQDLPLQRPSMVGHEQTQPRDLLAHGVRVIAPGAPLAAHLDGTGAPPLVNSLHHQGIKRLGAGLVAVAGAADGLVEAAILTPGLAGDAAGWWVRGVQWHPENLLALPQQRALWRDFAAALGTAVAQAGAAAA